MKTRILRILGLCLMSVVLATIAKAEGPKEGQWTMTMVTKMDNMPPAMAAAMKQMQNLPPEAMAAMKEAQAKSGVQMDFNAQGGATITVTQCVTNQNPLPKQMKDCQQTHETNGDTVTFHASCSHGGIQSESSGSMTYTGDSMQGQIKSHTQMPGGALDQTIDITGEYVGPCPQA